MSDFLATAVTAHMGWRSRLMAAIQSGRTPDPAVVRSDCNCALGKWLHGDGKQHSRRAEYTALLERHKQFHLTAASVVDLINARRVEEAQASLDHGAFKAQSRLAVEAIDDLRNALAGKPIRRPPALGEITIARKMSLGLGALALLAGASSAFQIGQTGGIPSGLPQIAALTSTVALAAGLVGLARWFSGAVARPLTELTHKMLKLEMGDDSVEVPVLKRRDEIGELAEALLAFKAGAAEKRRVDSEAEALRSAAAAEARRADEEAEARRTAAAAERENNERTRHEAIAREIERERAVVTQSIGSGLASLADKDLTSRLTSELPEAYRKLQSDFNAAIQQLEEAIHGVTDSTGLIGERTQEIASGADELSRRTEQQASNLEETAAALREITTTVTKSAEGAKHASEVAAVADEDAKRGAEVVRKAKEAMDEIAASSQQIGQIISKIDDIALQTNLLALNAGVEAARAGESGRGFAVVATEVRALALRSADAAKEIKSLVTNSTAHVGRGVALVAETGKSLQQIENRMTEINGAVAVIASGARDQATALAEINQAVNQMDQMTQQNAAMVEESSAATRSLAEETATLSRMVAQFRLGRGPREEALRRELAMAAPHAFARVAPPKPPAGASSREGQPAARPARGKIAAGARRTGGEDDWTEF